MSEIRDRLKRMVEEDRRALVEGLYRLPNGDLVRPIEIRRISVFEKSSDRFAVVVGLRDGGSSASYHETFEEACKARDKIGRDLASPGFIDAEASGS